MLDARRVIVDRAGRHAVRAGGDFAHPAARLQLHPGADRLRPIGDVGARLGALGAAGGAVAEMDAARPPAMRRTRHRGEGGPPVPAQSVHRPRIEPAGAPKRQRRQRRPMRRKRRVPREPRDAHHPVILGEERLEISVLKRPVIGHPIQRFHPEIRGVHAREMRGVHDGATADAVEIGDLHHRVIVVDRVVGHPAAAVGGDGEIIETPRLPVPPVGGEISRFHPVALFEAKDVHLGLGQAPRHRRPRGAGPDDQDIDFFRHAISSPPTVFPDGA